MSTKFIKSAQDIFTADDLLFEDVDMSEFGWPGQVRMAVFSAATRDALELKLFGDDGKARNIGNFRAEVVAASMINPDDGERIFKTQDDVDALGRKSAEAVDHLFKVASRLNKVFTVGEKVDQEVKNSSTVQTDSMHSE